ncbi:MAG: preprotein translocase subunit SecG [Gammaproteobacteria bacterium]|nr:preprotein translocase subunit SecG [Gammaproteobacteria bacterium]
MFVALIVVHVIVAVSLVLIVLLQTGRGAELGAAFGGMGQATCGRGQSTFISKLTTVLAVVFMSTSMSLAFISTERPRSSIVAPGATAPAPQRSEPAPAETATPVSPILPQTDAPQPGSGNTQ